MQKMSTLQHLIPPDLLSDQRFTYEVMQSKHVDQVVDVFTKAFCRSEPMTHYLKMDEKKYRIFARSVAEKAVNDQLSIVALTQHRVVACALVEDIADPGAIPDFDPKFVYILGLLERLGENFFSNKIFPLGQIAHLFITAVDETYRHLGLSKQVNFRAMQYAADRGFDFIYCELTNSYNEKGLIPHLMLPNKLIGSIIYDDFIYQGVKPFFQQEGVANAYLWAIRENAKLKYDENKRQVIEFLT